MRAHTPGRWYAERLPNTLCVIRSDADTHDVAIVQQLDDYERERANKYLLAAAPDLLEACKYALGAFATLDIVEGNPDRKRPIKDTLRAAIAKATGEEA